MVGVAVFAPEIMAELGDQLNVVYVPLPPAGDAVSIVVAPLQRLLFAAITDVIEGFGFTANTNAFEVSRQPLVPTTAT